mmetsp:Transcript_54358/g.97142  ORF Transcript_54358/g.97142 Transcript_54358/m.97142 type:complete len:230 (+) Transcript_54358:7772-8461(+)
MAKPSTQTSACMREALSVATTTESARSHSTRSLKMEGEAKRWPSMKGNSRRACSTVRARTRCSDPGASHTRVSGKEAAEKEREHKNSTRLLQKSWATTSTRACGTWTTLRAKGSSVTVEHQWMHQKVMKIKRVVNALTRVSSMMVSERARARCTGRPKMARRFWSCTPCSQTTRLTAPWRMRGALWASKKFVTSTARSLRTATSRFLEPCTESMLERRMKLEITTSRSS